MFQRIVVVICVVAVFLTACAAPEGDPVSIKQFAANKEYYASIYETRWHTEGAVVYISEDTDYFVVVGIPIPKSDDYGDDDFVIVRQDASELSIGDVLSIHSQVSEADIELDDGTDAVIYYLDPVYDHDVEKTGQIDIEDPDFEELIAAIENDIQSGHLTLFLITWFLLLSPASPIFNH